MTAIQWQSYGIISDFHTIAWEIIKNRRTEPFSFAAFSGLILSSRDTNMRRDLKSVLYL